MFTALLPSFNHKNYLFECVLSAVQSTLVTEVLIVDDGSSDGTTDILDRIKQLSPKIHILENKSGNLGAHRRLNQLALAASNRWLAVLNTDDLFVPGRFEAISRIASNSKAEMFFGDLVLIDGNGQRIGFRNSFKDNEYAWPIDVDINSLSSRGDWLPMLSLQNIAATTTNMIFTKDLHHSVGGFKDYRYCHDWDFIIRASTVKGRVAYVPTMISKYRIHATNTIKENRTKVIYDVRRMFYNLRVDFPDMFSDPGNTFIQNKYLQSCGEKFIALIADSKYTFDCLQDIIPDQELSIKVYLKSSDLPESIKYISFISNRDVLFLRPEDLVSISLSLNVKYCQKLIVNLPSNGGLTDDIVTLTFENISNLYTFKERSRVINLRGVGNMKKLPKNDDSHQSNEVHLTSEWEDYVSSDLFLPRSPILSINNKPLVFILPAFLAVGGVERLILDTVTLLRESYSFVIVNTEPLRPEQGSMHAEFAGVPIFDITEIAEQQEYLRVLEYLKTFYEPDLVWICNGAPWQVAHAEHIRGIFNNIPIVDHMAYDHNAGWINAFNNKGVAASDRFIAINKKIMDAMISKFAIKRESIDLVYHGTNLQRFDGQISNGDVKVQRKKDLNLKSDRMLFGMIGRLTAQKRPLDLIELSKNFVNDEFIWVGLGELEEDFVSKAENQKNVKLIPAQRDLVPIYQALDGLIVFSEFEGLPLVVLEALAMGVPILSTDVGAIKDVLDKYQSGIVFAPPGNISKLIEAFIKFKEEISILKEAASLSARQASIDFSSESMAKNYDQSFRKAIQDKILTRKDEYKISI